MISMAASWLRTNAPVQIKEIHFHFLVPGHSFMPQDRVFGRVKKVIKKKSVIAVTTEYIEILSKFIKVLKLVKKQVKFIIIYKYFN